MNRLSTEALSKINSSDELLLLLTGAPTDKLPILRERVRRFKAWLKEEFPDLSEEDILLIDDNYQRFKEVYSYSGCEVFLTIIEYEKLINP